MGKIKIENLPENVQISSEEMRRAFGGGITVFSIKGFTGFILGFPDVCKAPPGGFVPIPYPNVGSAADARKGSRSAERHPSEKDVFLE